MISNDKSKPLVYSCSGCSNAAQLANSLALALDRSGTFEMSCVAGVGAKLRPFVVEARSGREILTIDGCSLNCARRCLEAIDVLPHFSFTLQKEHIVKKKHVLPNPAETKRAKTSLKKFLKEKMNK